MEAMRRELGVQAGLGMPVCYLADAEKKVIVMENLKAKGYSMLKMEGTLKIVVLSYVQGTFSFFLFNVVQMIEYIPKQLCTWRNLISISMVFEAITVPNVFLKKVGQSRPFFIYFGPF